MFGGKRSKADASTRSDPSLRQGRRRPVAEAAKPTAAPGAFSYYSQRSSSAENTGRLDAEQTVARDMRPAGRLTPARKRLLSVIMVVLAGLVGYNLILTSQPHVVLLQDATTAYFLQDASVYHQTASDVLGESIFNSTKLTVDTAAVRTSLLKAYPEIKTVSVVLPVFGHQPQIYVEPYKPSFIVTTTAGNAFLLDATGRALAPASQIADVDALGVLTIQDRSGRVIELGSRALPSTTITFTETVVASLRAQSTEVTSLLLSSPYELDVKVAGKGYTIKFNVQSDALQQAGTYIATQKRLTTDKITPLEYIDVRVPERAYYK